MNFYRSCARLLAVSGVNDFSMFDLMKPDAKRLRRNLSAIINFAKFREERLEAVNKLTVELVRTELGEMKLLGFGYCDNSMCNMDWRCRKHAPKAT